MPGTYYSQAEVDRLIRQAEERGERRMRKRYSRRREYPEAYEASMREEVEALEDRVETLEINHRRLVHAVML
ncbi:MAG: hypothetical protein Q4G62_07175 [Pseudomonadota bacterium]|nr:hypothetical protein [Pseudomonadota bacterium]